MGGRRAGRGTVAAVGPSLSDAAGRGGLARLAADVAALGREVAALRQGLAEAFPSPGDALRRRGLPVAKAEPMEDVILPPDLSAEGRAALYAQLGKYSFRLFLRDLIACRDGFGSRDLTRFCSPRVARGYLRFLRDHDIIEPVSTGRYRLVRRTVRSFGGTLEWFVAEVFRRDFRCPATWGVRLRDAGTGGDYDVVALVEGALAYLEIKSSPPKHIEEAAVAGFVSRLEVLRPALAIFVVDTELRMKDKVVPLFEGALGRRPAPPPPVVRLWDETFRAGPAVYITNSRPGLVGNIGRCLRAWLATRA